MGTDPAPYMANLFLYSHEEEYISKLIQTDRVKARHFHATKRFIDDLDAINDGGEFGRVYGDIYPPELELKLEASGNHVSFLNLDIKIENGIFRYKLYEKRDDFPFSIVRMPYRDSNIPENIFYSALVGEFLRIGRSTLLLEDFIPKTNDFLGRMKSQGANYNRTIRALRKIIMNHSDSFSQFGLSVESLLNVSTSTLRE